jgi:hypothetical protein
MGDGFVVVAPARPRGSGGTRRACALVALAGTLVAGLLATAADVRVGRERPAVTQDLAAARAAATVVAARLSDATGSGTTRPRGAGKAGSAGCPEPCRDSARPALEALGRAGSRAARNAGRLRWQVASWTGADPGAVSAVRREARRAGTLAEAARQLTAVLGPLEDGRGDGAALDDLARGLSRYTSAAERAGAPGQDDLERASVAAGLLTGLSGADRPRTWLLCSPSRRCSRLRVDGGEVTRRREGELTSSPHDLVVRVDSSLSSEEMLFGAPEPVARQRFDARAVYRLLLERPGTVTSALPEEQIALRRLGG